jgi:hypothetical protein
MDANAPSAAKPQPKNFDKIITDKIIFRLGRFTEGTKTAG